LIGLSRIAASRPNAVMVSGARGGLGGTSGARLTGMSQASAMLTCGLAKTDYDKIGVAHSYWFRDRAP
jgi:hypothetical protein